MNNCTKLLAGLFFTICLQSPSQTILPAGYPDRTPGLDVLPGFINPPRGYGEVPFYWWQGDTLTRERLLWQLDQLSNKGISSLQINYSHQDSGGLTYGLSNPSKPALFSEAWWDLFKWFATEAGKRNMTVSLSDYTIGVGQGFSMDEAIKANPGLNGSVLKNLCDTLTGEGDIKVPANLLTLTAIKLKDDNSLIIETRINLLPLINNTATLKYNYGNEKWKVTGVYAERIIPSFDPMNPLSGKAYNRYFFEKFEEALPGRGRDALNFFFSDELDFRVRGNLWNTNFADEFRKRKGYDIIPYLDALFVDIGSVTPKIKLDYNDIIVSLSEENFFKPVYQWHQDRGMIFGCDHGGRGKEVTEFGDYFRTQRWNQGPGSDQPNLSKDIIKAKVAASIAHLYNRPRVWLEGFHSSGWGTSSADVTDAIFANFVAGYNLLSFHGLYYSTMGGWWEWAPPDNHFRMPYWNQADPLMNCIQRLSYLFSQGYHNCDVAIIYPTEPVIAEMDGRKSVRTAFETGQELYGKGIDFDFIDFESLARSEIRNAELNVTGEKYKVLIIPSMKAIRYSSLKKIEEFKNGGGIVVNIGDLPEATEKNGSDDSEVNSLVDRIFSQSQNLIQCEKAIEVSTLLKGKYQAGFYLIDEAVKSPYIMHRIIGRRDVFALYNIPAGTRCFFRAKGNVQLWNPWNGVIGSLTSYSKETADGTEVTMPLSSKEIQIIVFDPENRKEIDVIKHNLVVRETDLGKDWEFELKPSLDNQWGDYELPASKGFLNAQVRQLHFTETKEFTGGEIMPDESWKIVTCSYGPQFLKLGPLPILPSDSGLLALKPLTAGDEIKISGEKYIWEEYAFSWQKGVEGDYGHQGYHGLKGKMYDNFIRLGAMKDVKMSKVRVPEPAGNYYILSTFVIAPSEGTFDLMTGETKPSMLFINNSKTDPSKTKITLKKGANQLLLVYNKACETYFIVRKTGIARPKQQELSMVWYQDYAVLPYDCPNSNRNKGLFTFESAPGLKELGFAAYGKVKIWVDGKEVKTIDLGKKPDGLTSYKVIIKEIKSGSSQVVAEIEYKEGYRGPGSVPQYFSQLCGKGKIRLGDWSEIDGLRAYSGGAWYRKTIDMEVKDLKNKLEIDLGDLVSSAELFVNGKSAGIKLAPPWTFDVTNFFNNGKNKIEVLLYNTLANNYIGVPTRYRGKINSGLSGPVVLRILSEKNQE
jgi:hypothetical protein